MPQPAARFLLLAVAVLLLQPALAARQSDIAQQPALAVAGEGSRDGGEHEGGRPFFESPLDDESASLQPLFSGPASGLHSLLEGAASLAKANLSSFFGDGAGSLVEHAGALSASDGALTETAIEPMVLAITITGLAWMISSGIGYVVRTVQRKKLTKLDKEGMEQVLQRKQEVCDFLGDLYDQLCFQAHATKALLDLILSGLGLASSCQNDGMHVPEAFKSWRDFILDVEYQILGIYKIFGEDALCPIFKEPPVLNFVTPMSNTQQAGGGSLRRLMRQSHELTLMPKKAFQSRCVPSLLRAAIQYEGKNLGKEPWEVKQAFICDADEADLAQLWNKTFGWSCRALEVSSFRIANCGDVRICRKGRKPHLGHVWWAPETDGARTCLRNLHRCRHSFFREGGTWGDTRCAMLGATRSLCRGLNLCRWMPESHPPMCAATRGMVDTIFNNHRHPRADRGIRHQASSLRDSVEEDPTFSDGESFQEKHGLDDDTLRKPASPLAEATDPAVLTEEPLLEGKLRRPNPSPAGSTSGKSVFLPFVELRRKWSSSVELLIFPHVKREADTLLDQEAKELKRLMALAGVAPESGKQELYHMSGHLLVGIRNKDLAGWPSGARDGEDSHLVFKRKWVHLSLEQRALLIDRPTLPAHAAYVVPGEDDDNDRLEEIARVSLPDFASQLDLHDVAAPPDARETTARARMSPYCFTLGVRGREAWGRTIFCATTALARRRWGDAVRATMAFDPRKSTYLSSPNRRRAGVYREEKQLDVYSRMPWIQRTFRGFLVLDCGSKVDERGSDHSARHFWKGGPSCWVARSKGSDPRDAVFLWIQTSGCRDQDNNNCVNNAGEKKKWARRYVVLDMERLAWYKDISDAQPEGAVWIKDLRPDEEKVRWYMPWQDRDKPKADDYPEIEDYYALSCFRFVSHLHKRKQVHAKVVAHRFCADTEEAAREIVSNLLWAYVRFYELSGKREFLPEKMRGQGVPGAAQDSLFPATTPSRQVKELPPHFMPPTQKERVVAALMEADDDSGLEHVPTVESGLAASFVRLEHGMGAAMQLHEVFPERRGTELTLFGKFGPASLPQGALRSIRMPWRFYALQFTNELLRVRATGVGLDSTAETAELVDRSISLADIDHSSVTLEVVSDLEDEPPQVDPVTGEELELVMCVSFRLRKLLDNSAKPSGWPLQVFCGTRHQPMQQLHVHLRAQTKKWSKWSPQEPNTPPWATSVPRNLFSEPKFVELLQDVMHQTSESARLWGWRRTDCPLGCRCPVYAAPYSVPGLVVNASTDGHVRYVLRECPETKAEVHAVEIFTTSEISTEVVSDKIVGTESTLLRSAPVLSLRFITNAEPMIVHCEPMRDSPHPCRRPESAGSRLWSDYLPGDEHLPPPLPDTYGPTQLDPSVPNISPLASLCDDQSLAEVLDLLWRFVRNRDGEDLWDRWIGSGGGLLPETAQTIDFMLLQPLISTYRSETERHMMAKFDFAGFVSWDMDGVFRQCQPSNLKDILFRVRVGNRLTEQFFAVDDSGLTTPTSNADFHAQTPGKEAADAVLATMWQSQSGHGCAPNQIWHPLERKCYAFCMGMVEVLAKCHAVPQDVQGGTDCKSKLLKPRAPSKEKCNRACRVLFGSHPGCLLSDPEHLPKLENDFMREHAMGVWDQKIIFVDMTRAAIPAGVLVAMQLGSALPKWWTDSSAFTFLSGTSSVVATGSTVGWLASALNVGAVAMNVIFIIQELGGIISTLISARAERDWLKMAVEEQLNKINFAQCRLLQAIALRRQAMELSEGEGMRLVDDVIRGLSEYSNRLHLTPKMVSSTITKICDGPLPGHFGDQLRYSRKERCEQLLGKASPLAMWYTAKAPTRPTSRHSDQQKSHGKNKGAAKVEKADPEPPPKSRRKPARAATIAKNKEAAMAMLRKMLTSFLQDNILAPDRTDAKFRECTEKFPIAGYEKEAVEPVSALHVGWHMKGAGTDRWGDWLERLRRRSPGHRYEPVLKAGSSPKLHDAIAADAVGEKDAGDFQDLDTDSGDIDMKLGLGGNTQTVLLMERDPAQPPMTEIRLQILPKSPRSGPRAEESPASKYCYDQAVSGSTRGEIPVGLVPPLRTSQVCDEAAFAKERREGVEVAGGNECTVRVKIDKCRFISGHSERQCRKFCTKTQATYYRCYYDSETDSCKTGAKAANTSAFRCHDSCGDAAIPLLLAQCQAFQNKFGSEVAFTDTMRCGGAVDINYACQKNKLAGREVSNVFARQQEVFLTYTAQPGAPPIVDVQFGDSIIEQDLRKEYDGTGPIETYYRKRENLNHECTTGQVPGFLGGMRKTYLWYKQDWSMHLGFEETNTLALKVAAFARGCLADRNLTIDAPAAARQGLKPWYTRCKLCALSLDRGPIQGEGGGRVLGRKRVCHRKIAADGREVVQCSRRTTGRIRMQASMGRTAEDRETRRVYEWVGDVRYDETTGCEAIGLGELFAMTQVLEKTAHGTKWVDRPAIVDAGAANMRDFYSDNFHFVGAVRQFSDQKLFQYHPERQDFRAPRQIMCQQWARQLAALKGIKGHAQRRPEEYRQELHDCLRRFDRCEFGLLTCVRGAGEEPGEVGAPPVGHLRSFLTKELCLGAAERLKLGGFGASDMQDSLERALQASRCSQEAAAVNRESSGAPMPASKDGWLTVGSKAHRYFVLWPCFGFAPAGGSPAERGRATVPGAVPVLRGSACSLEGFAKGPKQGEEWDSCWTRTRVSYCKNLTMEECSRSCTRHGLTVDHKCMWVNDDGWSSCRSGRKFSEDSACSDSCGKNPDFRPVLSFSLRGIEEVSVPDNLLNLNDEADVDFSVQIVYDDKTYHLKVHGDRTNPKCVECFEPRKLAPASKWCYKPSNLFVGYCQALRTTCGAGFEKAKVAQDCPPDPKAMRNEVLRWRDALLSELVVLRADFFTRPVPHGFGKLSLFSRAAERGQVLANEESEQAVERLGRFHRGLQVGLGAKREAYGYGLEMGYYSLDGLVFGAARLKAADMAPAQLKSLYKGCERSYCIYEGYFADMSTVDRTVWPSGAYPVLLGRLMDSKKRTIYWGQFGLWYPHGQGVWEDPDADPPVKFEGVVKKEYRCFSGTWLEDGQMEHQYVPVLAGVLSRLRDSPIDDLEVLALTSRNVPAAIYELAEMLFGLTMQPGQAGGGTSGSGKIICRSRAVSNYESFMDQYRSISDAWLAISEFTTYAYGGRIDVTGTGTQLDVDIGIDDTPRLVEMHVERMLGLRNHIKDLRETDWRVANQVVKGAIKLLTEAQKEGRPFDPFESFWRDETPNPAHWTTWRQIRRTAALFQALGPRKYLQFQAVQDILHAIDKWLRYASEMYCSLCTKSWQREHRRPLRRDRSGEPQTAINTATAPWQPLASDTARERDLEEHAAKAPLPLAAEELGRSAKPKKRREPKPTLVVKFWRGRSLISAGGPGKSIAAYARVELAGKEMQTEPAKSGGVDPEWNGAHPVEFDGGPRGLDPQSTLRISVWHKSTFLGEYSCKLISLIQKERRSRKGWYKLQWPRDGSRPPAHAPLSDEGSAVLGEVQVSFEFTGLAKLLEYWPTDLEPTCGMAGAVTALVEGVQARLPLLLRELALMKERLTCAVRSTITGSFDFHPGCFVPLARRLRPHHDEASAKGCNSQGPGPVVLPIEGELRADVMGGVFSSEMKFSVAAFTDFPRGRGEPFYKGHEYLTMYLRKTESLTAR